MRSSIDQVVDILNAWKGDRRTVAVFLTSGRDGVVKFGGAVVEASPISLHVFGEGFAVEIDLSVATDFDWQDPTEAPPALREEAISLYDAILEVRSPSYRCLLCAFKREEERD